MKQLNWVKLFAPAVFAVLSCYSDIELPPETYQEFIAMRQSSSGNSEISSSSVAKPGSSSSVAKPGSSSSVAEPSSSSCKAIDNHYCSNGILRQYGSFTDPRSTPPQTYRTVVIGKQTWMAKNLNFAADSSTCYNRSEQYCNLYGRLYNWETANKACPPGWHLPSNAEWTALTDSAGGTHGAANVLKATHSWYNNHNGSDHYGFAALPGGIGFDNGRFNNVSEVGYWWTSTSVKDEDDLAWSRTMTHDSGGCFPYDDYKSNLFSVRCVKN